MAAIDPMAANDRMNSASSRLLPARRASAGFTLIEILVALVILLVGLLGLVGLQAKGQQAEMESYQRTQALVLLQDLADRMNATNRGQSPPSCSTRMRARSYESTSGPMGPSAIGAARCASRNCG